MTNTEKFTPFTVEDNSGRRYNLVQMIGKGGQGSVYIEENQNFLVKIVKKMNAGFADRLRSQFRKIRQLDFDGIPITYPLELLRPPHVGYVMTFLKGMQPIENLIKPPVRCNDLVEWYIGTGGLRWRLKILEKCADALHKLHSKGLVYCDVSPKNIFVSDDVEDAKVFLIDIDNLIVESNSDGVYTPWYGAPEIVHKKIGNDSLTDVFSFAVVAYKTLAIDHPLIGDNIRDGDPDMEQQALSGQMPWIHHALDDSNRSGTGFSPIKDDILSSKLFNLFQRTFEAGLLDRQQRPGMGEWSRWLHRAYHFTLICKNCKGSYYANKSACTWCKAPRPAYIIAAVDVIGLDTNQTEIKVIKSNESGFCLDTHAKIFLTRKMLGYPDENEQPILEIEVDIDRISIRSVDGRSYWMTASDWKPAHGLTGAKIKMVDENQKRFPLNWQFHFGEPTQDHRRLRFNLKPGE